MRSLKGAIRSWTIWFNAALASLLGVLPLTVEIIPVLQDYLPASIYQYLALIVVIGNIVLRFRTTQPLSVK